MSGRSNTSSVRAAEGLDALPRPARPVPLLVVVEVVPVLDSRSRSYWTPNRAAEVMGDDGDEVASHAIELAELLGRFALAIEDAAERVFAPLAIGEVPGDLGEATAARRRRPRSEVMTTSAQNSGAVLPDPPALALPPSLLERGGAGPCSGTPSRRSSSV